MTVPIMVNLPDDVYQSLVRTSSKSGMQVHVMIEKAVTQSVRYPQARRRKSPDGSKRAYHRATPDLLEAVRHMNAAGLSDTAIAEKLELGQPTISAWRRKLGLNSPSTHARRQPSKPTRAAAAGGLVELAGVK
jgi:DNA-binding NarL/FixJ family response regulator